jgi:hypothetical protein
LSEHLRGQSLPASLQRTVKRGAEIIYCRDVGPHTKYFPYLELVEKFEHPLVTVDDDIIYAPYMLEKLVDAWHSMSNFIHCHRARRINFVDLQLAPYKSWAMCRSTEPSFENFATGVSGVIYPPRFLFALKVAGDSFLQCCPKADDIWLNVNALRAGFPVRQIKAQAIHFCEIPFSRRTALFKTNLHGEKNDEQIRATYTSEDIPLMKKTIFDSFS